MKYFFSFLFLSLLVMSCSSSDDSNSNGNNEDDNQEEPQELLLLKNVFKDGELDEHYEYFSDNKLKKSNGFIDENPLEVVYEYVGDTITETLYREDGMSIGFVKKFPVTTSTVKFEQYDEENLLHSYYLYTLEDSTCSISSVEFINDNAGISRGTYYNYIDENCSFEATFTNSGLLNGHQLNDDKNSYQESIRTTLLNVETHHNAIEKKVWNINNELSPSYSYNSVYEYNEEDYPIMETRTYIDGDIVVFTYEYY